MVFIRIMHMIFLMEKKCLRYGKKRKLMRVHLKLAFKVIWPLFPTPIYLNDADRSEFSFYCKTSFKKHCNMALY